MSNDAPIYIPDEPTIESRRLTDFGRWLKSNRGLEFGCDYFALQRWSVEEPEVFWCSILEYFETLYAGDPEPAVANPRQLPGARWFPNIRLNFAENLLRAPDERAALIATDETGYTRRWSYGDLRKQVAVLQQRFENWGLDSSARVAAVLPNVPEAVVAMLATTSIGATWSSVSPDFGVGGIVDRLAAVKPKVLVVCSGYQFGGKRFDVRDKIAEVMQQLPSVEYVIVVSDDTTGPMPELGPQLHGWQECVVGPAPAVPQFRRMAFDHPLYIVFTSGTTGKPKCIVHGTGGVLLQLLKEHGLHCDVWPGDVMFFPTTLGWMMWNWLVNGLAAGATLLLYNGSPAYPDLKILPDLAHKHGVSLLGLASALIENYRKAGLDLRESHDFGQVRLIFAGGSVLSPAASRYVAEKLAPGTYLASCSGGTDILSCFICTNPWGPVWAGELQAAALGMDVKVFNEDGQAVVGEKGELVCTSPAPSMPLGFLDDPGGKRFDRAYFQRFPGVWAHGDFVKQTQHGGFVIYGRSDSVLNPGGVRIGTAEIYRPLDRIAEVEEAVAVGLEREDDMDVVLFVKLRTSQELDSELTERIRQTIKTHASPRHVPRVVLSADDVPRTLNGKVAESAVREVVNGRPVKQREALANPESLRFFENRPELRSLP